jgi:transcriptional regulator of acetoin/glycerol metabolism
VPSPSPGGSPTAIAPGPGPSPDERSSLEAALDTHRWNRAETAKALGLSRSTLWRRMRTLGLARAVGSG